MSYIPDKPDKTPIEKVKERVGQVETQLAATVLERNELRRQLAELDSTHSLEISELKKSTSEEISEMKKSTSAEISELRSLVEALTKSFESFILPIVPTPIPPVPDKKVDGEDGNNLVEFPFRGNAFDENGLVYFVATQGKTAKYENAHKLNERTKGGMCASMSCVQSGNGSSPYLFLCHNVEGLVSNWTGGGRLAWMRVDIGESRRFIVSHYCLRNNCSPSQTVCNWAFEASETGEDEWRTLRSHKNDNSIPRESHSVADWEVDVCGQRETGYRYFRVLQTGGNAGGGHYLGLNGIELYGTLLTSR